MAMLLSHLLCAQQQLVPLWQHSWPFGQGDEFLGDPPGTDNHVTVDPVTGVVYCTVDDAWKNGSQRGEYLFTFDPDGLDLTPEPPPLVAHTVVQDNTFFQNINGTTALAAGDGRLYGTHRFSAITDRGSFAMGGPLDGTRWTTSLFQPAPWPGEELRHVAVDGDRVVVEGNGTLLGLSTAGLPLWRVTVGSTNVQGMTAHNGMLYLVVNGAIRRHALEDGAVQDPWPGPGAPFGKVFLTVANDQLFTLHTNTGGTYTVTKRDLAGTQAWAYDLLLPGAHEAKGLVVDGLGRAWCAISPMYNEGEPVGPGMVAMVSAEGTSSQFFLYGTYLRSIAGHNNRIFITGAVAGEEFHTYLAAFDAQLPTGTVQTTRPRAFTLYPNPSRGQVWLQGPMDRVSRMHVVDGSGRLVWQGAAQPGQALELGHLAPGSYLLGVEEPSGTTVVRLSIAE